MDIQILDEDKFRYRLGDLVILGNDALTKMTHKDSPFRNTIGYEYAITTLNGNKFLDFELLKSIIKTHTQKHQYPIPPSNVLVIHYRAGDRKRVNGAEIAVLSSYVKNACADSFLSKVQIVTAFHYGDKVGADEVNELNKVNFAILDELLASIKQIGIDVSVKPTGGFDEDFCYLSNAKHLLPTKGGFSILAGLCNPHLVYPTFPETMAAIRHYEEIRPVSLSAEDLHMTLKKMIKNKKYKPIRLLLKKFKPVANPDN